MKGDGHFECAADNQHSEGAACGIDEYAGS